MARYLTELNIAERKFWQDDGDYAFSQDSVLLANLAKLKKTDTVLDLGCGTGILATLACIKKGVKSAVGLELRRELAEIAKENATMNAIPFSVICDDVKNARRALKSESFDKVLCNPPYFSGSDGFHQNAEINSEISSENAELSSLIARKSEIGNVGRKLSRQESTATLDDFVAAAAYALKFGGNLWIVMKIARLQELMASLDSHNLAAKEMILIYPKLSLGADAVIVNAKKGGKHRLTARTFIAMHEDGAFSEEYLELYR